MIYILKLMGGETFEITEPEFKQLAGTEGKVYIKSCDSLVNMSSVSAIFPKHDSDQIHDRKNQMIGVLHDGTQVRRHFGQWVDATYQVPDDKGNYQPVKFDPTYYPEVAHDCVYTPEEFEKVKGLTSSDRLKLMMGESTPKQLENREFTSISDIIKRI